MKIERLISGGAAVALALGLAASAKASVKTITIQGVASGYSYPETYVYDPSLVWNSGPPFYQTEIGGLVPNNNAEPTSFSGDFTATYMVNIYGPNTVSATLTIPGVITGGGDGWAGETFQPDGSLNIWMELAGGYCGHMPNSVCDFGLDSNVNISHTGVSSVGSFYEKDFELVWYPGAGSGVDVIDTFRDITGSLNATSVTIAGVPEPTTWVMLILGVGMIGFAARRRNGGHRSHGITSTTIPGRPALVAARCASRLLYSAA